MVSIEFVSLNDQWIECMKKKFGSMSPVKIYKGDIRRVDCSGTVFVSPANSLGFMDGGIDRVLSREMFVGAESAIRAKITELGFVTKLGR